MLAHVIMACSMYGCKLEPDSHMQLVWDTLHPIWPMLRNFLRCSELRALATETNTPRTGSGRKAWAKPRVEPLSELIYASMLMMQCGKATFDAGDITSLRYLATLVLQVYKCNSRGEPTMFPGTKGNRKKFHHSATVLQLLSVWPLLDKMRPAVTHAVTTWTVPKWATRTPAKRKVPVVPSAVQLISDDDGSLGSEAPVLARTRARTQTVWYCPQTSVAQEASPVLAVHNEQRSAYRVFFDVVSNLNIQVVEAQLSMMYTLEACGTWIPPCAPPSANFDKWMARLPHQRRIHDTVDREDKDNLFTAKHNITKTFKRCRNANVHVNTYYHCIRHTALQLSKAVFASALAERTLYPDELVACEDAILLTIEEAYHATSYSRFEQTTLDPGTTANLRRMDVSFHAGILQQLVTAGLIRDQYFDPLGVMHVCRPVPATLSRNDDLRELLAAFVEHNLLGTTDQLKSKPLRSEIVEEEATVALLVPCAGAEHLVVVPPTNTEPCGGAESLVVVPHTTTDHTTQVVPVRRTPWTHALLRPGQTIIHVDYLFDWIKHASLADVAFRKRRDSLQLWVKALSRLFNGVIMGSDTEAMAMISQNAFDLLDKDVAGAARDDFAATDAAMSGYTKTEIVQRAHQFAKMMTTEIHKYATNGAPRSQSRRRALDPKAAAMKQIVKKKRKSRAGQVRKRPAKKTKT